MCKVGTNSGQLSALFFEAADNPLLLFNDNWRTEAIVYLAALDSSSRGVLDLNAPSSVSSVQTQANRAADAIQRAVLKHARGIDKLDNTLLLDGASEMTTASGHMNQVAEMVDNFCLNR